MHMLLDDIWKISFVVCWNNSIILWYNHYVAASPFLRFESQLKNKSIYEQGKAAINLWPFNGSTQVTHSVIKNVPDMHLRSSSASINVIVVQSHVLFWKMMINQVKSNMTNVIGWQHDKIINIVNHYMW